MIEIIVACAIYMGTFTIPSGWIVVSVEPGHTSSSGLLLVPSQINPYILRPDPATSGTPTIINMKRQAKRGETVKLPDQCQDIQVPE